MVNLTQSRKLEKAVSPQLWQQSSFSGDPGGLSTCASYLGRMNKECRMPEEALAPCEIPLLSGIESHPGIASFMHISSAYSWLSFHLCQMTTWAYFFDNRHESFVLCFWTLGSWSVPTRAVRNQCGRVVISEGQRLSLISFVIIVSL